MKGFSKDILLIDFETTGVDLEKSLPIQLGAVLLDKNSLDEKDSFLSYIKQDLSTMSSESQQIHGITERDLVDAPSPKEVINKFIEKFGTEVYLASWSQMLDQSMIIKLLNDADKDIYTYDYHYIDIWSISYLEMAKNGHGDIIRSEDAFNFFGLKPRKAHNALEDCRHTAELLRKIYNK